MAGCLVFHWKQKKRIGKTKEGMQKWFECLLAWGRQEWQAWVLSLCRLVSLAGNWGNNGVHPSPMQVVGTWESRRGNTNGWWQVEGGRIVGWGWAGGCLVWSHPKHTPCLVWVCLFTHGILSCLAGTISTCCSVLSGEATTCLGR